MQYFGINGAFMVAHLPFLNNTRRGGGGSGEGWGGLPRTGSLPVNGGTVAVAKVGQACLALTPFLLTGHAGGASAPTALSSLI